MGHTFPAEALSLANLILFAVLALVAWLERPRERITVAFALLATVLALDAAVGLFVNSAATVAALGARIRFAYIVGGLVPLAALLHVLCISGFDRRLGEALAGGLRIGRAVGAVGASIGLFELLLLLPTPNALVRGYARHADGAVTPDFTPVAALALGVVVTSACGLILALMLRALREARRRSRRRLIRLNLVGLLVVMLSGPIVGVILPMVGVRSQAAVDLLIAVGSVFFFVAIHRYRIDRIDELNRSLERKVAQRTRSLAEAQTSLVQSAKMAALGNLVAGVTHELNTPVGAIVSAGDTAERAVARLRRELGDRGAPRVDHLLACIEQVNNVASRAGGRVAEIIERLQRFIDLDGARRRPVDLRDGLMVTIALLEHELPTGVEIERNLGELPLVKCNPAELNQVFMHLLRNAIAATPAGTICVSASSCGARVRITVADSGRGIPPDELDDLFEPKLTRDAGRVRMGIGLATCRQLVERHGGTIDVCSELGRGTIIAATLPVS